MYEHYDIAIWKDGYEHIFTYEAENLAEAKALAREDVPNAERIILIKIHEKE